MTLFKTGLAYCSIAVFATLLQGCGGGDSDSSTATNTTNTTPTSTTTNNNPPASQGTTTNPNGQGANSFTIYEFLKLHDYQTANGVVHVTGGTVPDSWFEGLGLKPIHLIYSSKILTCPANTPNCTKEQMVLDDNLIQQEAAQGAENEVVSLDLENWDNTRFTPSTPTSNGLSILDNLSTILARYRQLKPNATIGFYGELPQNTFGWQPNRNAQFAQINLSYAPLGKQVNFYSPVLYNYGGGDVADRTNWQQTMSFALDQTKQIDTLNQTNKPIYPYLTPCVNQGCTQVLSYDEMYWRLKTLKAADVNGAIIWIASGAIDENTGNALVLDPNQGWLKAIADVAAGN